MDLVRSSSRVGWRLVHRKKLLGIGNAALVPPHQHASAGAHRDSERAQIVYREVASHPRQPRRDAWSTERVILRREVVVCRLRDGRSLQASLRATDWTHCERVSIAGFRQERCCVGEPAVDVRLAMGRER